MKANSVHSNQSPLEDYRSRLLRLRAFMNENLLAQLNKTEYHSHSVFETQKTLKSALTCLQKNNLNDEVIVRVEELLVDKSDRNKACHKAYFDFLKEVKASRKYTNFKPSTLEIIGQRSPLPVVTNKPLRDTFTKP